MKRALWIILMGLVLIGPGTASATCILYDGSDVLSDEPTGAIVQETCTTTRGTRVSLADLISGEDQTNNLLMTSGGVVRQTTMASTVTTNTTSSAVALPVGSKSIYGQVVGTGAVTQTQAIYGDIDSDAANGILLCTLTLSGTTRTQDACPVITANFSYYYVITTNTTGTSATGAIYAMY